MTRDVKFIAFLIWTVLLCCWPPRGSSQLKHSVCAQEANLCSASASRDPCWRKPSWVCDPASTAIPEKNLMLLHVRDYKLLSQHIQMVITLEGILKVWDSKFNQQRVQIPRKVSISRISCSWKTLLMYLSFNCSNKWVPWQRIFTKTRDIYSAVSVTILKSNYQNETD